MTSTTTNSSNDDTTTVNSASSNNAIPATTANLNIINSSTNSIEADFYKMKGRLAWQILYQEIRKESYREAIENNLSTFASKLPENRGLNRYRDVNPYDHSRIILFRGDVHYINANLVEMKRADRKYILTQGPLENTVGHFWLMIWEQKTKAILMLNKLIEKKRAKCHQYWPSEKGSDEVLKLNDVNLTVELLRCEQYENFCRRWFKLTDIDTNQSREIIQFNYTTWPDFGIPSSPVAFLQFLKQVRDSGALDHNIGPAVVHCSAGIGRSGTFCLVDCCLVLIEREGENNVSLQEILYELRRCRMGLIQTADQLYFSYQAIIEGMKLFKDHQFLEYNETPIILEDHQLTLDESPPPLPPRTHSLMLQATVSNNTPADETESKYSPLSQSPPKLKNKLNNENCNENIFNDNSFENSKDALNNFINNERGDDAMLNRPLPPLPEKQNQNLLDRVHESNSEEDGDVNEHDDIVNHNESDNPTEECSKAYNDDDDLNDNLRKLESESDVKIIKSGNGNTEKLVVSSLTDDTMQSGKSVNGNVKIGEMSGVELKRRKRVERQAGIEEKVNEIKRKQREIENGKKSAKKRRSIVTYIAAGVIVGVICVYAYSKLA